MKPLLPLAAFLFITSCCNPQPACPTTPDPDLDAPPEARASACHKAGLRLNEKHCKEARPDWDALCVTMMDAHVPLRPSCLATIAKCEEIDTRCR